MTTITEHHVTSETISFTGCTDTSLTGVLQNTGTSVTLTASNDLDLELKHDHSTLTLNFNTDASQWPPEASVTVTLKPTGSPQSVPCSFSANPVNTTFEILVNTGSGQIVFDPKIKVIPPIRS